MQWWECGSSSPLRARLGVTVPLFGLGDLCRVATADCSRGLQSTGKRGQDVSRSDRGIERRRAAFFRRGILRCRYATHRAALLPWTEVHGYCPSRGAPWSAGTCSSRHSSDLSRRASLVREPLPRLLRGQVRGGTAGTSSSTPRRFAPPTRYFRVSGVAVTSVRWPSRVMMIFTGWPIFTASRA